MEEWNSRHHSWNITMLSPAGVRRGAPSSSWAIIPAKGAKDWTLMTVPFVICAQGKMLGRRAPSCQHLLLWSEQSLYHSLSKI